MNLTLLNPDDATNGAAPGVPGSVPGSESGSDARADLASERVTTTVVMVDSDIAKRWLDLNRRNRPLSNTTVNRYTSDMANGRWKFAGDPIRFDVTGQLLDGQHRLTALSRCPHVTIPMVIIRGLARESQTVMDQGSRRTPGQQLSIAGVKNSHTVAAAVRVFITWEKGLLFRDARLKNQITTPDIEQFVKEHPGLIDKFNALHGFIVKNDAPPAVAGAAAIKFLMVDEGSASEFFNLLATGAGTAGNPIVTLDQRLRRMRREKLREPERDVLSFFVLAWNAWRDDKPMTKFQRPRGGSWNRDNFPVPH